MSTAGTAPRITTTTVGSYPIPEWLVAAPSDQALIDATRVVLATQEQAGVDLVCDGELYRFEVNHPETNGMIEYFVRPLAGVRRLTPRDCLRALCMFRLANPASELRIAGGRELHLGTLQPLGLYPANSIFVGDYLTTKGQPPEHDYRMIEQMGFVVTRREVDGGAG